MDDITGSIVNKFYVFVEFILNRQYGAICLFFLIRFFEIKILTNNDHLKDQRVRFIWDGNNRGGSHHMVALRFTGKVHSIEP